MESNGKIKTLVLKFEGYNASPFFNLRQVIREEKATLGKLGATEDHDFIYYGEEGKEPSNTLGLIGAFYKRSPIKAGAVNFVNRAFEQFKDNDYNQVICDSHSFGAHILSEVLAEMNKRYRDLTENYPNNQESQEKFKKFYDAFKQIDFNQPFVSNRYADLRGRNQFTSLFLWRNVKTNQNAIKEFTKNNNNVKINFLIAESDKAINANSQK